MPDVTKLFSKFATRTSKLAGKPATFVLAVALVVAWACTGPLFGFSDVWQLVINTSTTIITFLMIFVLQNSQNRDSEAIQAKLDELILVGAAHNRLVGVEKLDERALDKLKKELEAQAEEIGEEQEERSEETVSTR
jgi:low affinity Fe/Cu permease